MHGAELHIAETTGWRALLTHAQIAADVHLSPPVEEHLVGLLFRYVGADIVPADVECGFIDRVERILNADTSDPAVVGDQCLLFAGLMAEHAIRKGVPVTYFVEVGRSAYREYALRHDSALHALLCAEFVRVLDTLQTLRVLQSGETCLDGFNAYHLWRDQGSRHGWRVLRAMSAALPADASGSRHRH
jgi:hypothetical protein